MAEKSRKWQKKIIKVAEENMEHWTLRQSREQNFMEGGGFGNFKL